MSLHAPATTELLACHFKISLWMPFKPGIPPHGSSNFFCAASSSYSPACILAKLIFASLVRCISSLLMVQIKALGLSAVLLRTWKVLKQSCYIPVCCEVCRHSASRKIPGKNVNLERVLSVMPLLKRGHINETSFRRFSFFVADLTWETKSEKIQKNMKVLIFPRML